jgi:hypothetical protein
MRFTGKTAAFLITLTLLLIAPFISRAEVLVSTTGIGAIEGNNSAKSEQSALQDAFRKAALQVSLKYIPQTSLSDLVEQIPDFLLSRGMQDIIQYQITSRSQSNGVLTLNVDVRMNEEPLKAWINSRSLTRPAFARPRVLLMVSDSSGGKKVYEWWNDRGKGAYSAFEAQFAQELKKYGENVIDTPQSSKINRSDMLKPAELGRSQGADFVIAGSLTTLPVINKLAESSLKISLVDVKSQATLSSWTVTHKSDISTPLLNATMINEIIKPVRSLISGRIISHAPVSSRKTLCIEGITNYVTYQSIVNALKSMESVSKLNVTGVYGSSHSICHSLELRSSLTDVMENLRQKQIADADMLVEDNKAVIRILHE